MFFQLAGGDVVQDDATLPKPAGVEWHTLFSVGDGVTRVAPVFRHAAAAIAWLRQGIAEKRKLPRYTRKSLADFSVPGTASFDEGEYGVGPANNYDELACGPVLLFRGQQQVEYPLAPTLAWSIWPSMVLGRGSSADGVKVNEAEQRCTSAFTNKFFSKWSVHRRFRWTKGLSVPERSAIARHHGFFTWTLDCALDPAIAACFATGGVTQRAEAGIGSIQVIDEHRLSRVFGVRPDITNHQGYQQRSWHRIDIHTANQNTPVLVNQKRVGGLIDGEFWSAIHNHQPAFDFMYCDLYLAPGREVGRMWNQKWCGVETRYEEYSWRQLVFAIQILERVSERVLFRQNSILYEEPSAGVTAGRLLEADDFSAAVTEYARNKGLRPGSVTTEFLARG